MMKKIYNNRLSIVSFLVILIIIIINLFYHVSLVNDLKNLIQQYHEPHNIEALKLISHFSVWKYIMTARYSQFILFLAPILIATPAIYNFYMEYRSGFFQNVLLMKKYSRYIRESIFKSFMKSSWWISLISIVVFLIAYIVYPNSVVTSNNNEILYFSDAFLKSPMLGFIMSTINMFLVSVFCISIGIIVTRYIKKFPLVILATFIINICVAVIFESFVGQFLSSLLGQLYLPNSLSIYNSWALATVDYIWLNTVFLLILNIVALFLMYKSYKNKEGVILNYE